MLCSAFYFQKYVNVLHLVVRPSNTRYNLCDRNPVVIFGCRNCGGNSEYTTRAVEPELCFVHFFWLQIRAEVKVCVGVVSCSGDWIPISPLSATWTRPLPSTPLLLLYLLADKGNATHAGTHTQDGSGWLGSRL